MSVNDRVSDMITRIRNGQGAYLPVVNCQWSKLLEALCAVLEREGYIRAFSVVEAGANKKELKIELKYHEGKPAIQEINRVSKSGRRIYAAVGKLPKVYNGLGISVLSTSKGVMSDFEARQQHVGGEILCNVF